MIERAEFDLASNQFTEVFIEQLLQSITGIPSHHAGGMTVDRLQAFLAARIGVSRRSIRAVVSCLTMMRLITETGDVIGRSPSGDRLRRDVRSLGSYPFAVAVLRSGLMADQVRKLRPVLRRDGDGYECGRSAAQAAAPQLVGLLARMPDVWVGGKIVIGRGSGLELDSVWNELPPASRINWQAAEKRRKAVGDRAELYSLQLERSAHVGALERITWVSRDDDSLGYDIEVAGSQTRRIEVKGSAGQEVQFLLSSNEYDVAGQYGSAYEIHFWGTIDIRCDPLEEFDRLKAAGYPVVIPDPVSSLSQQPWEIEPAQYRVCRRPD
jgi:hypothetical protein